MSKLKNFGGNLASMLNIVSPSFLLYMVFWPENVIVKIGLLKSVSTFSSELCGFFYTSNL